jgi:3-hydroxybutyryl-CoA dehydrogenase
MKTLINTIGIVGSGQMGRGIAQVAAQSGFSVKLFDISDSKLKEAMQFIGSLLEKGVAKGKWDQQSAQKTLSSISSTLNLADLSNCDLVIEAATENKQIKFKLFQDLDNICSPQTILASNTSSISITEIAAQTKRPELVAGMHFMNPVPVMKLVEGIRGLITTDETFNQIKAVTEKMGKVFIAANDRPGFAVNRILMPMINEAVFALYENVASAKDIDDAMKLGTNQPMGPLELADFIGLDTCLAIMEVLFEGFGEDKYRPCPLLKQYVTAKRLGKKVGHGFYQY